MDFTGLWIVFSLSFVVALSGALMPGPLLSYTIARTVETRRRGWLVGPRVIAGHAALEAAVLCGLLFGVLEFLRSPLAIRIIGTLGGAFLVWSGIAMLVALVRGRLAVPPDANAGRVARAGPLARLGPFWSGALVSLSNPYWWVWWITVGAASLVRFGVSFRSWQALLAFFLGHEAGDLAWYSSVSALVHAGRRRIPSVVYECLLGLCGVAITGFGIWLGVSPYLSS